MNHLCFPFWMNHIKIYKLCHNKQLDLRSEPWAFLRSTQSFKNYQMKVNCFQSFHARATQSPGILWCLLSCDPCVKFFPHLSQTKGRHLCFPFWMNHIKIYKLCHNKQLDLRSEPWAFLRSTQSFKNYQMKVNCFQSFHARATQSPGILWCLLSCDPCVKFFPHLSQTKGRSPVCVLMWLFNVVAPANAREQYPHLNGFLLAWMTAWARSWAGWAKLSEQWPHWYGFFGASLHTWTWSMVLWGKDFLHWPHFHKLSSVMLLNAGWLILVALFCPSS